MFQRSTPTLAHMPKVNSFRALLNDQLDDLKKMLDQADSKSSKSLVHDLRVLSRRFRASLAVAEAADPLLKLKALRKRIEALTETLGPVRSLDVAVSDLKKKINGAEPSLAATLARVSEKIRKRRQRLKRSLPDDLALGKWEKALKCWNPQQVSPDSKRIHETLDQELSNAALQVQEDFRLFRKKGKIQRLHALRIKLKKWRYFYEMKEKLFPSFENVDRLPLAKELQDRLGLIHDREALGEALQRPGIKRLVKKHGNVAVFKVFLKDLKAEMKREMEDFRLNGEKTIMELMQTAEIVGPASVQA